VLVMARRGVGKKVVKTTQNCNTSPQLAVNSCLWR
jgi:hypothetical protein